MNHQKRRSSRDKKETPKAKEAKDDLKAKKQKKQRKLSDSPPQSDKASTPSPRSSRRVHTLGTETSPRQELMEVETSNENDTLQPSDTTKSSTMKQKLKFSSKFSPDSLEEIFTFVSDNAESLYGQGDLAPPDLDNFIDDPAKEINCQWLGDAYKVSSSDKVYYEALLVNGEEVRLFDHVTLAVKQKSRSHLVTVARVISFFEDKGRKKVTLEWYYRPPDILTIMNRIKLTGVNPLTPVLESYDDDPKKPFKRKRGRPPKKRLLNIEDTVRTLEDSTDFEIFTSIRPYIDALSVSAIGQKCIVDHVLPTWTPRQPAEKSKKWFFYRKALELKTCSLVICKARPNKPRIWIELLEKKNRELRLTHSKPKESFHSLNGSDYDKKKKKRKEKEEEEDLETDFEEEIISPFESENSEESNNTAFLSTRTADTAQQIKEYVAPSQLVNIYPQICETMKNLGSLIENRLGKMEKLLEGVTNDIRISLEELKGSLNEVKQNNVTNMTISEADGLDHEYDQLHHTTSYPEMFGAPFM